MRAGNSKFGDPIGSLRPWRGRVQFEWKGQTAERQSSPDKALIQALKRGHAILADDGGEMGCPEAYEGTHGPTQSYHRHLACLAFLAPDFQAQILEGRQPPGLSLERVLRKGVPPSWGDSRQRFGFPAHH